MIEGATHDAVAPRVGRGLQESAINAGLPSPADVALWYGDEIYRVALRMTRSDSAAQDVVQEVLLRVMLSYGFDGNRGPLRSWLHMVTQSTAIDWIRREAAHELRVIRVGALHSASDVVVEEAVSARGDADLVRAAVAQLPESERVVVSLAYFGGLSYRQVAHQLGLAEGTVKSQIRRALTRLAHIVGPIVNTA